MAIAKMTFDAFAKWLSYSLLRHRDLSYVYFFYT